MKHSIEYIHQQFLKSSGICIDSRKVSPQCIFIAIKGENFDGNRFASDALQNGARLAIIDKPQYATNDRYILVKDTQDCLRDLATFHRLQFNIPVLAITGTNGKTTTKELTAAVLSGKFKVLSTQGNLNNHIGVPLTLLQLDEGHDIAVIEMGANHQGEIDALCKIACPNAGIITNIGKAHLEGFGSFEGVVKAKSELYQYIKEINGIVFVNVANKRLMELSASINKITYGDDKAANYYSKPIGILPFISIEISGFDQKINTQLYGSYNFENLAAAACIGQHFGVANALIKQAIENYLPQNNRSQIIRKKSNTLYLDAYNANPSSMAEALKNFSLVQSENKTIIIGDMFELGSENRREHQKIIDLIVELEFNFVVLIGSDFYETENEFVNFHHTEAACQYLLKHPVKNASVLLKGSRGMQLEKLVDYL